VQLTALGDLKLGVEQFLNGECKRLTDILAIGQYALNSLRFVGAAVEGKQSTFAIANISRRGGNGARQAFVGYQRRYSV